MKRILIPIALIAALIAAPALAMGERAGERISLFFGDQTYPTSEPFHIAHGWAFAPPEDRPVYGYFDFHLEVDGSPYQKDFVDRTQAANATFSWIWVYNFPEGMTGTHEFTGTWFTTCGYLVSVGSLPGPCENNTEVVPSGTRTITVDFE